MIERFGKAPPVCSTCNCCEDGTTLAEIKVTFSGVAGIGGCDCSGWNDGEGFIALLCEEDCVDSVRCWVGEGPNNATFYVSAWCGTFVVGEEACGEIPEGADFLHYEDGVGFWGVHVPGWTFQGQGDIKRCIPGGTFPPMDCSLAAPFTFPDPPNGESVVCDWENATCTLSRVTA